MTPANQWMKEQPRWEATVSPFIKQFEYNGVMCAGIITTTKFGDTMFEKLAIRPLSSCHDIGLGAGQAIHKEFKSPVKQAITESPNQ